MTTLEELQAKRPVDRALIEHHKRIMRDQVRAYRLRELREQTSMSLFASPPARLAPPR